LGTLHVIQRKKVINIELMSEDRKMKKEKRYTATITGLAIAGLISATGCSTSDQATKTPTRAPSPRASLPQSQSEAGALKAPGFTTDTLRPGVQNKSTLEALRRGDTPPPLGDGGLKDVYFDFDQYELDTEDRAILRAHADWLKKNLTARVEIEGHSDERGTNEYNLALGAMRAQAAKDYLTSLGISADRIATTSYGEEIPACQSQSEDCRQKNRRDKFVITAQTPVR